VFKGKRGSHSLPISQDKKNVGQKSYSIKALIDARRIMGRTKEFAEAIDATPEQVYKWINWGSEPLHHKMVLTAEVTGIDLSCLSLGTFKANKRFKSLTSPKKSLRDFYEN